MIFDQEIILVLLIILASTLTRSTFGFGDAMVAMPLLSIVIGIKTATPLVALIATTIASVILIKQWKNVDLRSAWRLIISAIAGIPVGLYFLTELNENLVKGILAVIIILFSLYNLFRPRLITLTNDRYAIFFGFAGGILGGAYNTNGPPAIIYGVLRQWDPARFRATLQGYFLPTGGFIIVGHAIAGLWTREVLIDYLIVLPVVLIAIFTGSLLNRKIQMESFNKYVYIMLVLLGSVLLLNSLNILIIK